MIRKAVVGACVVAFGGVLSMNLTMSTARAASTAAPQCEINRPIVFSDLNWDSNRFHTALARFIVEKGYGCKTDATPGDTMPLIMALIRGDNDVMMELWEENVKDVWQKAEKQGKVEKVGVNFPDAVQGWFIPKYLAEGKAKGLKSVADLPKYKDLFQDPEEPSKGRFTNCPAGWGCEDVNSKKLKAYGLLKDYTNFRVGTGAALDAAIAGAYKRKKPILFYYWGPTWIMGKYDMVQLQEPKYDPKVWDNLLKNDNAKQACAYPVVAVEVAVSKPFADKAPKIINFLSHYHTNNAMVSRALTYMQENNVSAKDAALHFLKTQQKVWTKWVPADVAKRVESALN
ncbi:ABC transporter substrate-binding protein [Varunaivibrio sulfuroxidans]|uniref:Glycine betaine/proline transport system substrate-binding protein n=1 Tax=Varunaivibrio sulfuroxidans TaxID=1773489 RepID=A0A4R3JFR2_9PROT|nr:ABC transporter substrate-binding protein [Varunaivibrio sulfuroxidans]TCS64123.1 glycine betaine/proline transport system substrate-binding protein [Varunaivibrio sulfuroxidans]WES31429.1 ABC transporter substrate-binding protein [Varunaivibrio sulfuroxidans]